MRSLPHLSAIFQKLYFKSILMNTESFLLKSSLNATKVQHNRPTKIQFQSLKRATTHKFKRYCPLT